MVAEGLADSGRLLEFRVGPGRYAILLEDVLGVQDPAEIGAVSDRWVVFQGHPVAALDARVLWREGSGSPAMTASPGVIIVRSGRGSIALIVDRIEGIVEGVEIRPLPSLVAPFVRKVFQGVTLHADGGRLVINSAALAGTAAVGGEGGTGEA